MISLLIGGSHVFKFKHILTKAVAASEASVSARPPAAGMQAARQLLET
jgi:hypothetical protein